MPPARFAGCSCSGLEAVDLYNLQRRTKLFDWDGRNVGWVGVVAELFSLLWVVSTIRMVTKCEMQSLVVPGMQPSPAFSAPWLPISPGWWISEAVSLVCRVPASFRHLIGPKLRACWFEIRDIFNCRLWFTNFKEFYVLFHGVGGKFTRKETCSGIALHCPPYIRTHINKSNFKPASTACMLLSELLRHAFCVVPCTIVAWNTFSKACPRRFDYQGIKI